MGAGRTRGICSKMKKITLVLAFVATALVISSCGAGTKVTYSPEESFLNLVKITDEANGAVIGNGTNFNVASFGDISKSTIGYSKSGRYYWSTGRLLSVSPDGEEIAFLSRDATGIGKKNIFSKEDNIRIRKVFGAGTSTQRTFRNVNSVFWGADDNLYFADESNSSTNPYIGSVNAHVGNIIRQHTNNNTDSNPTLSPDGSTLFFTRKDNIGPFIWALDLNKGTLTSCARGFNQYPVSNNEFYCVRNSAAGRSEIWYINFQTGQETLILTDPKISFTNPSVSPDGNWIAVQGNGADKNKKQSLDIYVVKKDGTNFTRLTYLNSTDCNPVWGKDGKTIFFISSRGNKEEWFNVWKMNFAL